MVVKEIRFGPQTDDHDYDFKLKHAKGFLEDGSKVKAYVFFKGRSIIFKDQGEVLLLRFASDLADHAKVEQLPQLEGKRMIIMLAPKKAPTAKKNNQKKAAPVVEKKPTPAEESQTVEPTVEPIVDPIVDSSVEIDTNPATENDAHTAAE